MTTPTIRAVIDGSEVTRAETEAWERRRLPRAARRIGLAVPEGDLAVARHAFADAKLDLGATEIHRRLARALTVSDLLCRATATAARGGRVMSVCDLHVTGGNAASFVDWFTDDTRADYEHSMVAANPDHFLVATAYDGRQEVIATAGGSPLPTRFFVDYGDRTFGRNPHGPAFSAESVGIARTVSGTGIGGVRHRFRDTDDGFHAHLVTEFPKTLLPAIVRQQRWHLAAEFSNLVEFAFSPT